MNEIFVKSFAKDKILNCRRLKLVQINVFDMSSAVTTKTELNFISSILKQFHVLKASPFLNNFAFRIKSDKFSLKLINRNEVLLVQ